MTQHPTGFALHHAEISYQRAHAQVFGRAIDQHFLGELLRRFYIKAIHEVQQITAGYQQTWLVVEL